MSETFCQFNCLIPVVNKNKREIQYNIKSKKNLSEHIYMMRKIKFERTEKSSKAASSSPASRFPL